MRNNLPKKYLVLGVIVLFLGLIIGSAVNAIRIENRQIVGKTADDYDIPINFNGYTDITVEEAWEMLNDPSPANGIQIPIDVRTYGEWHSERIDTPYPEHPRHYSLSSLQNGKILQEFMSFYGGTEIILYCKAGSRSRSAAQILVNNEFNGTIYNMLGGITEWKGERFPTKVGNQLPYKPDKPSGQIIVNIGISYSYYTITTDPDYDTIKYGWDWNGDSTVDEWTDYNLSGTSSNMSHSWNKNGTYNVKVKAEDGVGDQSDFSSELTVVINNPPNTPVITGLKNGTAETEYEYTFVAVDPEEYNVSYCIDWGEGASEVCIGPYASGEEATVKHSWDTQGTYTIKAKAIDIHEAESDWGTLEVNMPKNKATNSLIYIKWLTEHFSLLAILMQLPLFEKLLDTR